MSMWIYVCVASIHPMLKNPGEITKDRGPRYFKDEFEMWY
jgi:hypothetical protein